MTTAGKDIKIMMELWDKMLAIVRAQYPQASEEEKYQLAKNAVYMKLNLPIWN